LGKLVEESDQKFEDVEPYEMFQTLSNSRRRAVLRYMDDNEEEVRVGDLARQIAGFENNFDVKNVHHTKRKTVYTTLIQHHLDKMDEVDALDYDRNRKIVYPADNLESFQDFIGHNLEDPIDIYPSQ
jgi:hypothetical protein